MSSRLALYLLGPPQLFLDNAPITAERRKVIALLAYLAIERGQRPRELLSALLWPDYDQSKAFTNLRHTLWEIQRYIGEGWLITDRGTIGLNENADPSQGPGQVWLDVRQFESLLAQSRAQNDISLRIPLLVECTKLYHHHFMTGFSLKDSPSFNEWAFAEAEDLRGQLTGALTGLSEDYCALGQAEKAIPYARRLITLDPLNESAHCQLMKIYSQAGQHSAALKQYHICEEILRKKLNLDPQPETYALYKQIRKGDLKPSLAMSIDTEAAALLHRKPPSSHKPTWPAQSIPKRLLSSMVFIWLVMLIVAIFGTFYFHNYIQKLFTERASLFTRSTEAYNPHPDPSDYFDSKGIPMRLVPAGRFAMGSDSGEADEAPVHQVYLDAFYIDKYEVTNALYKSCVDLGVCKPPQNITSSTRSNYYGNPEFDHFPVIYVDWYMAKIYCGWRGGGLPTEAQWEKAARGTDGRIYPGGKSLDPSMANYENNTGDTTAIGSYKNAVSPYGVHDMAGNVWEWVADWYSRTYYITTLSSNPLGPERGRYRVLRGGSWISYKSFLRAVERGINVDSSFTNSIGFRCTRDARP